ncbi:MAG TPA: tetratricopeptide repeat protein, partial [Fodinibius sp.]|nr:tetratricopeptide repeat protein [Fodinibius sp.]
GGRTLIRLMGLQQISDVLNVSIEGEPISSDTLSLEPLEVYYDTLDISDDTENLKIVLGDHKLSYSGASGTDSFDRPLETTLTTEEPTAAQLYQRATNQADNRNYAEALSTFAAVIVKDTAYTEAYAGLAELYYRRGEYREALEYSAQALSHDTYHPRTNFIHGTIKKRMGESASALEALGWAARSLEYRSAAYASMAEIYLKANRLDRAVEFAGQALNYNWTNINAYKILAVSYRKQERDENAQSILDQILKIDPLNHFARFEQYLLDDSEEQLKEFTSLIRNELPRETYLEMAVFYASAGLAPEATRLLEQAPDHPMIWYWLAYLTKNSQAAQSRDYLNRALSESPYLVFPFRAESIPVLEWAGEQDKSWKNSYYLGLIYWHLGRTAEAGDLFGSLQEVPDYAPFYLTRGKLWEELDEPDELVLNDYQKANRLNPDGWRSWHALTGYYLAAGALEKALNNAKRAYQQYPDRDPVEMDYARTLLAAEEYETAAALLDRMHILPFEGASEGHILFERTHTFLALGQIVKGEFKEALSTLQKAQTWPEELGVGKPYHPDLRVQLYLEAAVNRELGNSGRADELFSEVAEYTRERPQRRNAGYYFGALALQNIGDEEGARSLLETWSSEQPDNAMASWAMAAFNQNAEQAEKIEQQVLGSQLNVDSPFPLLIEATRVLEQLSGQD